MLFIQELEHVEEVKVDNSNPRIQFFPPNFKNMNPESIKQKMIDLEAENKAQKPMGSIKLSRSASDDVNSISQLKDPQQNSKVFPHGILPSTTPKSAHKVLNDGRIEGSSTVRSEGSWAQFRSEKHLDDGEVMSMVESLKHYIAARKVSKFFCVPLSLKFQCLSLTCKSTYFCNRC